jgi:hypothetical protein
MSMKISNDTIVNRTSDLLICNTTLTTVPPRSPTTAVATRNNAIRCLKQDDEVKEVYKIAIEVPLGEAYFLEK